MNTCSTCIHWHNGPCLILNTELDGYNNDPDIIGWNGNDLVYGDLMTGKNFGCIHWRENIAENEIKLFHRGKCIAKYKLSGSYSNGDVLELKLLFTID